MPLLNDLLDFNDHPLIPPPSAQLLPNICPLSGCSIAFLFPPMPPSDAVVCRGYGRLMVVCMAFFRNEPITEIVRRLNLSADGEAGTQLLARSAITQAGNASGLPRGVAVSPDGSCLGAERYPKDDWKVCSSSPLMAHSCARRMNLNCVNTSAPATHPRNGRALSGDASGGPDEPEQPCLTGCRHRPLSQQ